MRDFYFSQIHFKTAPRSSAQYIQGKEKRWDKEKQEISKFLCLQLVRPEFTQVSNRTLPVNQHSIEMQAGIKVEAGIEAFHPVTGVVFCS